MSKHPEKNETEYNWLVTDKIGLTLKLMKRAEARREREMDEKRETITSGEPQYVDIRKLDIKEHLSKLYRQHRDWRSIADELAEAIYSTIRTYDNFAYDTSLQEALENYEKMRESENVSET